MMVAAEICCPLKCLPAYYQNLQINNTTTNLFHVRTGQEFTATGSSSTQLGRSARSVTTCAAKSGGFSLNSVFKSCQTCRGQGAIECPGCKGTGRNKKNGNIFERWKCYECQGFGLKGCPGCGKGGLTPEQRGER